jgi:hypothetical protein
MLVQGLLKTPVAQSALALTLLAILVIQPANYWMQEQPSRSLSRSVSVVPLQALKGRALPDGELEFVRARPRNVLPLPESEERPYVVGSRYGADQP